MNEDEHLSIQLGYTEVFLPDANDKPSEVTRGYWIFANRRSGDYPRQTSNNGKWLVFVPIAQLDEVWARIKQATEEGQLGKDAKVKTAGPDPNVSGPDTSVICVYTYDWTDESDVRRIRQALRELGVTQRIPYKWDGDTRAGRYRSTGHTRISKYYE